MPINHLRDLASYLARLDAYGVPRHPGIDKAFVLNDHVQGLMSLPTVPDHLLGLEPDQVTDVWRQLAMTSGGSSAPIENAANLLQGRLWENAKTALADHVTVILEHLRPHFTEAATAVTAAAETGIKPTADAQSVIDLDSPDAITAWRNLRPSAEKLADIARLWVDLCETLQLPPHVTQAARAVGERPDWTVCFVHPQTGITSGHHLDGTAPWRWLSLAIATGGSLRLNSPEEAQRMLHGDGESPGWIICAAGALVRDDEGRELQMYRGQWLPTWLDQEQTDRLIDSGFVVAAKPAALRPPDKTPDRADEPRRMSVR